MDGGRNRACDTPPGLLVPFVAVTIQMRAKLAFRQEGWSRSVTAVGCGRCARSA